MENYQEPLSRETIRQRPAMFIGSAGTTGLHNLIVGLVDMACASLPLDTLRISIAISQDQFIQIRFTAQSGISELYKQLAGERLQAFDDQLFAAAVAALSVGYSLVQEDGIKIEFQPDPFIFGDAAVEYFGLLDLLREQSVRYPGISIKLSGDYRGWLQQNEFSVPGGLQEDFTEQLKALPKPFPVVSFNGIVGGLRLQICAAWRGDWYPQPEARMIAGNQRYNLDEAVLKGTLSALRAACKPLIPKETRTEWRFKDSALQRELVLVAALGRAVPEPQVTALDPVEISKLLKPLLTKALDTDPEAARTFMNRFNDRQMVRGIMEKFEQLRKDR